MAHYNSGKNHPKFIDLTNKVFGKLIIKDYVRHPTLKTKEWVWAAHCECGMICYARTRQFTKAKPQQECINCARKTAGSNLAPKVDKRTAGFNKMFGRYKRGAKSRGFSFELSRESFEEIATKHCTYCGDSPSLMGHDYPIKCVGVDRVDSNKGYILTNVVPCCTVCNRMKSDYEVDEFYSHLTKILKHKKEK